MLKDVNKYQNEYWELISILKSETFKDRHWEVGPFLLFNHLTFLLFSCLKQRCMGLAPSLITGILLYNG